MNIKKLFRCTRELNFATILNLNKFFILQRFLLELQHLEIFFSKIKFSIFYFSIHHCLWTEIKMNERYVTFVCSYITVAGRYVRILEHVLLFAIVNSSRGSFSINFILSSFIVMSRLSLLCLSASPSLFPVRHNSR